MSLYIYLFVCDGNISPSDREPLGVSKGGQRTEPSIELVIRFKEPLLCLGQIMSASEPCLGMFLQ